MQRSLNSKGPGTDHALKLVSIAARIFEYKFGVVEVVRDIEHRSLMDDITSAEGSFVAWSDGDGIIISVVRIREGNNLCFI